MYFNCAFSAGTIILMFYFRHLWLYDELNTNSNLDYQRIHSLSLYSDGPILISTVQTSKERINATALVNGDQLWSKICNYIFTTVFFNVDFFTFEINFCVFSKFQLTILVMLVIKSDLKKADFLKLKCTYDITKCVWWFSVFNFIYVKNKDLHFYK